MPNYVNCEKVLTKSKIPLKEKKRKSQMVFVNDSLKKIRKIKIDGCRITEGLRCDYLIIDDTGFEHYVELKGSKIEYAIKQITKTIDTVSSVPKNEKKEAFIVSSRCPLASTEIQKHQKNLIKNYNTFLTVKNGVCEHVL